MSLILVCFYKNGMLPINSQNCDALRYKYQQEIHCNEVAILPYYIANLNIEYTYLQKTGEYQEFNNICFVDTLDHTSFEGKQMDLFAMSLENTARIRRQNEKKISVIIGNPPYNAKQENFNDNNANRSYESIDKRIKSTYIKEGKAQNQIVLYDMYVRFIRWASDRLKDNGIIAFITNNSFIDGLTFDGFRKVLNDEFSHIYIIDLGGNIRQGDKTGNVFNIMIGVAITFLVRKNNVGVEYHSTQITSNNLTQITSNNCEIYYYKSIENSGRDKLDFIGNSKLKEINFTHIIPNNNHWINQSDNDFDDLLPLIDKEVKSGKSEEAIFKLFSRGIATQRDEWVYDFNKENLEKKVRFLIDIYQQSLKDNNFIDKNKVKWDRELTKYLERKIEKEFNNDQILLSLYHPFTEQYLYFDKHFNGMTYQWFNIYDKEDIENKFIAFSGIASEKPFMLLASNYIVNVSFVGGGSATQCLPLYTYDKEGKREENITDWALEKFREYYQPSPPQPPSPTGEGGEETTVTLLSSTIGEGGEESITTILASSTIGEGGEESIISSSDSPLSLGEGLGVRVNFPSGKDLSSIVGVNRQIPRELLEKAKELRKKQTPTEKILWECLRGNRLLDFKFRRQHNIASFIVDFYCHSAKLVIEIDGKIHEELEQNKKDKNRDEWLKNNGLKVLRIKNEDILNNLENTLNIIIENLLPSPVEDGLGVRVNSPVEKAQNVRANPITKEDIFYYVYGVLHNPKYREKYELNLKRELPRIPFYDNFYQWVNWGKKLMNLHLNYEEIEPYNLKRIDVKKSPKIVLNNNEERSPLTPLNKGGNKMPKVKLKVDKIKHQIIIDDVTILTEIPPMAWEYKLGNRSALEWILDQYKEKKPKDKTIVERFNNYHFADYKEKVIDLLMRVTTVSVETMKIIKEMENIDN